MRKLLVLLAVVILAAGCKMPVAPDEGKVYVVNSLWEVVKTVDRSAREIVGEDVTAEVEAYNATTLDDYLRIYIDEVPDIDSAPPVDVFVVNPITYAVQSEARGITRRALIDDIELWRAEATAQLLFIDHVPPPPIIIPPPSMFAWYALYVVDSAGAIVFEDHCGWTAEEVWDGAWILDGGWRDADHYRETTRNAYYSYVVTHPGHTLVEHQLYSAP